MKPEARAMISYEKKADNCSPERITEVWKQAQSYRAYPDLVQKLTRPVVEAFWNSEKTFRLNPVTTQALVSIITKFLAAADPKDALANGIRYRLEQADNAAFWREARDTGADRHAARFIKERSGFLPFAP